MSTLSPLRQVTMVMFRFVAVAMPHWVLLSSWVLGSAPLHRIVSGACYRLGTNLLPQLRSQWQVFITVTVYKG